jgi:2-polyprenyl-6-methoxyphenol hydroxylase-like FAD-dependent oxidoreductase
VSELLLGGDGWSPARFDPYADERRERLRRLRNGSRLVGTLYTTFGPDGVALRERAFPRIFSDPVLAGLMLCGFGGPESAPPEAFEDEAVERALAP